MLLAPEKLSAAGIGPSEERFRQALRRIDLTPASGRSGVKVALIGYRGKVGPVLHPALEAAGHQVTPIGREDAIEIEATMRRVNFTRPDVVYVTVARSLEQGVANIVGTTGLGREEQTARRARFRGAGRAAVRSAQLRRRERC